MLFSHEGDVLAQSQMELGQIYPGQGMVEHDPMEIWDLCRRTVSDCLSSPGVDPSECVAFGITNQRETVVVWNRQTGMPVFNAIVWQDRRTSDVCDRIKAEGFSEDILERTGLQTDAYFSGTKIGWILDNVPGVRQSAIEGDMAFGTVDSWLIWNLTSGKVHATDDTNASRTMLFNIHEGRWDDRIIEHMGIPKGMLPRIMPSGGVFGYVDPTLFGISPPISGVIGDQQSALFGQGCFHRGDVKITFGTGGFMLMNIGDRPRISSKGLLTTVAWAIGEDHDYAVEGSVYIAGAAVQWLRDGLEIIGESAETEDMAFSVDDTAGCYFVPAFVGLGAPHWDQNARGTIMGLTRSTNRCHIARATLESIAFQTNDVLCAMNADSGVDIRRVKVDGGASANDFLCQFLADITGVEIERPLCIESTARGAAYLAGLVVGFWNDRSSLDFRTDRVFVPSMSDELRAEKISGWNRAIRCTRMWSSDEKGE